MSLGWLVAQALKFRQPQRLLIGDEVLELANQLWQEAFTDAVKQEGESAVSEGWPADHLPARENVIEVRSRRLER